MTTLTSAQIENLNNSMSAAQDVDLGTRLGQAKGSYTAVTADDTAGSLAIDSGLTAIVGWNVQIYRSDANIAHDAVVTASGGTLTVADGSTYAITADDVINYDIW